MNMPEFQQSVLARQVLTPLDSSVHSVDGGKHLPGGHAHSPAFLARPVPGFADYRTPIRGLYLCGAAAQPGGGVMGAAGANAAREMLRKR